MLLCILAGDPAAGTITGTVDKPAAVTKLVAVNRSEDKRYPGEVDAKTGKFTVKGLPLGAAYDLIFEADGAMLEGVNLNVPHSDYEVEQPMTKDDVKAITESVKSLNQFENNVEVMTVVGNIQHAAVLLNKTRTEPFVNQVPGEIIWRVEVWRFEKPEETWIKDQGGDLFVVLHRERIQKADFEKKSLTLDPALGGVVLTEKLSDVELGKVILPSNERGVRLRSAAAGTK
jgi:hypothetical protein